MPVDFSKCLFSSVDMGGCGLLRSYLPAKHLGGAFSGGFNKNLSYEGFKYVFLQRHYNPEFFTIINYLHALGIKVYYDLDDDLWNIDKQNPAKKHYTYDILSNIERIISMCDGVYVSTTPLKKIVEPLNSNIHVVPNLVELPVLPNKVSKEKIRIGYAGSPSHVIDFSKSLISAIKKLNHKHKDKIEFVFIGYVPDDLKNIVTYHYGIEPNMYLETINYLDFDIALAPLKNTVFNRSKSNLKWLDYSVCGACTVASNVFPYEEINHMYNGVLVYDEREWYDTLLYLINKLDLVKDIANASKEHVLQNYSWNKASHKQRNVYNSTLK